MATKRTVLLILLVAMVFIFWISRPILPLVVISAIIAYLLSPIIDLLERLRIPRSIGTHLALSAAARWYALLPILLVPVLIRQLASISNFDVPSTVRDLLAWSNQTIYTLPDTMTVFGVEVPIDEVVNQIQTNYQEFNFIPTLAEVLTYIQQLFITATSVVSTTAFISFNVVGGIFQVVITVLIVFFLSLYMTKDAPRIRAYVASLFPESYQSEVVDLFRRVGYIWQAFFRGQIMLSVVIGFVTWMALTAVGMPGALLLALLAGFLEVIPNLGPVLAMIPAVIIALIQGSPALAEIGINNFGFAIIVVAIYFIIQQLENNILVPRIIGSSVNLHPIIVICGVVVGFNVFGILGALLAAPTIASTRVLGSYIHAKLLGYEPFLDQDPLRRRRSQVVYRRTVTGDELAAASPASNRPIPSETASKQEHSDSAAAQHERKNASSLPAFGQSDGSPGASSQDIAGSTTSA